MEGEAKVRGSRCRRRERAARMQKQALRCGQSADEGDESPGRSPAKPPRPPNRKKRNKEPVFEEDVIDGFAILSFRTYEDLESTIKSREPETRPSSPELLLNSKINCNDKHPPPASSPTPPRTKTKPARTGLNKVRKGSSRVAGDEHSRPPGPGGPDTPPVSINARTQQQPPHNRSASGDRLSDCSTRSSSGRGYMCDSESDSERASDAGSDLFSGPAHHPRPPQAPSLGQAAASPASTAATTTTTPAGAAAAPPTAVTTASCTPTTTTNAAAASSAPPAAAPCVPSARSSPPLARRGPPSPVALLHNGPTWQPADPQPPQPASAASAPVTPAVTSSPSPVVSTPTTTSAAPAAAVVGASGVASSGPSLGPSLVGPSVPQQRPRLAPGSPAPCRLPSAEPSPPPAPSLVSELLSQPPFLPAEALNGNHSSSSSSSASLAGPREHHLFNNRTPTTPATTPPVGAPPHAAAATSVGGAAVPPLRNGNAFAGHGSSPSPLLASHLVHNPGSREGSSGSVSKPVTPAAAAPAPAPLFPFSLVQPPPHSRGSPQSSFLAQLPTPPPAARPGLAVTPTRAPTPTSSLGSSHSNSSLSSLSQLSQSLQGKESSGSSSSGRGGSRNNTPSLAPPMGSVAERSALAGYSNASSSNSLTSLVFSKPWAGPGAGSYPGVPSSSNGPPSLGTPPMGAHRPTPPLPVSSAGGSSSTTSSVSSAAAAAAAAAAAGLGFPPHPGMFAAPPIPPPAAAPGLASAALAMPGGPAAFVPDSPLLPNQDLLRRELDTRFLASQDRSIAIPPPPYMRTEMHHHPTQQAQPPQHHAAAAASLHPHSPFLPPALAGSLVPQPSPHLYDKFHPKLDSPFYSRSAALGLSGYAGLSPLLNPTMASGTPFVAPAHLAAFQPKKSGRWCAMHVRIAWEIYNHQQKQQQQQQSSESAASSHKSSGPPSVGGVSAQSASSAPSSAGLSAKGDLLRAPNHHLYSSLPRPHDLSAFPSALLGAAGAGHPRGPPFETSPHGNFLTPSPSHIASMSRMPVSTTSSSLSRSTASRVLPPPGMSPFARPGFPPGFVAAAQASNAYGTLGGLAGLSANSAASLFAGRGDLGAAAAAGCLAQDPWGRLHRGAPFGPLGGAAPPTGGGPPGGAGGGGAWGGLKAEADRERLEQQQHEGEKQRRLEAAAADKERKEREAAAAMEKAKEIEREKKAQEERQRERDRESRLHLHHSLPEGMLRNGDYMDPRATTNSHHGLVRDREPHSRPSDWGSLREAPTRSPARPPKMEGPPHSFEPPPPQPPKVEVRVKEERREPDEPERKRPAPPPPAAAPAPPVVPSSEDFRNAHFLGLGQAERAAFWGAAAAAAGPLGGPPGADPYRSLLDFHHSAAAARSEMDREQLQRYRLLGPMVAFHERFRDVSELERLAIERELQSKLAAAPPLRATDATPFSALFPPLAPPNPYLGSLAGLAAQGRAGAKNGPSPQAPPGSRPEGAVPPPLIPCGSGGGAGGPNGGAPPHGLSALNHKMVGPLVDHGAHHEVALYAKERRELANHKAEGQLR